MTKTDTPRQDIYSRITDQIVSALKRGVKPWTQPWNAGHAAGPVCRPLRFNGETYSGINVLTLWASAMERHFAAPIWMTFQHIRRTGEPESTWAIVLIDRLLDREQQVRHTLDLVDDSLVEAPDEAGRIVKTHRSVTPPEVQLMSLIFRMNPS